MERRRMQNSSYSPPPHIIQESSSPVKLPLAPILATPPDRRGNAMLSTRRGTSIFSPNQTLDHPYNPPPPPSQSFSQKDPSPDPDPPPSQPHAPPSQEPGATTTAASVKYRECLKNHAASMGGHVVDGCGEFMPNGEEGTAGALKCAACDCHRNFHRKEIDGEAKQLQLPLYLRNPANHLHKHSHSYSKSVPTMVNFGGGGVAAESSSEDLDAFRSGGSGQTSRKRFRTKFSQEQKDRMQEFAARIGWRIQKQDEEEVNQFCDEVGVKRQVFKVWMHNNKQAMKKRPI